MTHNFRQQLDYANSEQDEKFWQSAYQKAFPIMRFAKNFADNMEAQRAGVDRTIYLPFGGKLRFDEKKRRKDYGDILIEYMSNDRTKSPGWIAKPLQINYIAYAFMDTRRVLFIPFAELQAVWQEHGENWKAKYGTVPAKNATYTTLSVPVPEDVICKLIRVIKVRL
jgi:hypothetical protein